MAQAHKKEREGWSERRAWPACLCFASFLPSKHEWHDPRVKDTDPSSAARLHHMIMNLSPLPLSPPTMADDIVGLAAIAAALHY